MSGEILMTIREFRKKYGLDEVKAFTKALDVARGVGYRGIRVKTRWSSTGAYVYAERTMLKIARALKIALNPTGALTRSEPAEYMTIQEFRRLVPGLSGDFSQLVATWCRRHNLLKSLERPRKYPFAALKRFAEKEGKKVPDFSCSAALRQDLEHNMTIADFRRAVPGLSSEFARSVNNFCIKRGLVIGVAPHKYPLNVLAMFAEKEGKKVPALAPQAESRQGVKPDDNNPIIKQDLFDLGETENGNKEPQSIATVDEIDAEFEGVEAVRCLRFLATSCAGIQQQLDNQIIHQEATSNALNETNRLLRELLAIWKGDNQ